MMSPDQADQALCAQVGGDLFFMTDDLSHKERGYYSWEIQKAKAICKDCPVMVPCLEEALEDPSITGIWGGTTGNERRLIRKQRAAS